jgi:hypothetical protein
VPLGIGRTDDRELLQVTEFQHFVLLDGVDWDDPHKEKKLRPFQTENCPPNCAISPVMSVTQISPKRVLRKPTHKPIPVQRSTRAAFRATRESILPPSSVDQRCICRGRDRRSARHASFQDRGPSTRTCRLRRQAECVRCRRRQLVVCSWPAGRSCARRENAQRVAKRPDRRSARPDLPPTGRFLNTMVS